MAEAVRENLALWGLPVLPELPARGPGAAMVGRTLGALPELGFEHGPFGWLASDSGGVDQRRAAATLRDDLDILAEAADGYAGPLVVSLAGPWTLMATVDLARGGRMLGDHGARRDLVAAVAEALPALGAAVRSRVPGAEPVLKIDEPALGAVLGGQVPTESGLHRHRSVPADEVQAGLRQLVAAAGGELVVHSCAPAPVRLLVTSGLRTLALDASVVRRDDLDVLAEHVDGGGALWLGVVPTHQGPVVPSVREVVAATDRFLRPLELGRRLLGQLWLTPGCGLAGFSREAATGVARVLRDAAGEVTEALSA